MSLLSLLALLGCSSGEIVVGGAESGGTPDTVPESGPPVDSGSTEDLPDNPAPVVLSVALDPPGGTFVGTQEVSVATEAAVATTYTLDGSLPGASDAPYTGPITLDESTQLRVRVEDADGAVTYAAGSFLRVAADAADFTSNLPLVVLSSERPLPQDDDAYATIGLQIHDVGDDGRAHLLGEVSEAQRAGLRIRGSSTSGDPKHSYALEIRDAGDDEDKSTALLGMPSESDWVLYAPLQFDRAFMRNALMYALSNEMGRYAPRTRFVEVYEAGRGGDVQADGYVGIYVLMERIKRSPDRVDIAAMTPDDITLPELTGGYIFKRDRLGDDESGFDAGLADGAFSFADSLVYVYPQEDDIVGSQRSYLTSAVDAFADALIAPGGISPADGRHWSEHIDMDAWIDHHILNMYPKNPDALRLSGYMYKDREGPIVAGPIWDFDRALGCADDDRSEDPRWWDATNQTSDTTDMFEYGWFKALFADPTFTTAYWARWNVLLDDTLSVEHVDGLIDAMAAELAEAAPRNYARWSSYPARGDGTFQAEVNLLKSWIEQRHAWIAACLASYPDAPQDCRGD